MKLGPRAIRREAIDRLLEKRKIVEQLGRAIWLYVALVSAASKEGLVCRSLERLTKDLSVPEAKITEWLDRLLRADLVRVTSPAPFLVIRLTLWPGNPGNAGFSAQRDLHSNSYSKSSQAISFPKALEDRGLGEGDLGERISTVLDDAQEGEVERIIAHYPADILVSVLGRVEKTPPEKIRKSKTAFFRFLLASSSKPPHDNQRTPHNPT